MTDHASAGLELWRNAPAAAVGGGESIKAAAVRLLGEFEGVQDAIREVQSSLAKVGGVIGFYDEARGGFTQGQIILNP